MRPGGVQYRNMAEEAHLLLSAVKSCGGKFGLGVPIDVLRGSKVLAILAIHFYKLSFSHLLWNVQFLVVSTSVGRVLSNDNNVRTKICSGATWHSRELFTTSSSWNTRLTVVSTLVS